MVGKGNRRALNVFPGFKAGVNGHELAAVAGRGKAALVDHVGDRKGLPLGAAEERNVGQGRLEGNPPDENRCHRREKHQVAGLAGPAGVLGLDIASQWVSAGLIPT